MAARWIGKNYSGPWFQDFKKLFLFERGANSYCQKNGIKLIKTKSGNIFRYTLPIEVPHYNVTRIVNITLTERYSSLPKIVVDGPSDSPHRFDSKYLCIWYPWDNKECRWIYTDGLLQLIALIQIHLFKEYWWREFDEWLGPEVKHTYTIDAPEENHTATQVHARQR